MRRMGLKKYIVFILNVLLVNSLKLNKNIKMTDNESDPDNVFNGVYTECFLHLSYTCLQRKTLLYLKELNNLSEVSVIGDYMKFVKVNDADILDDAGKGKATNNSDELAFMIDKAIDNFFANHVIKFNALGRDISTSRSIDEFVGRKKRKGGGGGGGGGDHGGDHDGKKKMMMMAMMCMKMKLMMMVPAMMGMMGMMSFKGMMFSMMSFMIAKMMLLMKLLEKRGAGGGAVGGGGGGDGGWAASAGGGGAWMPAGGQDYGGGGYDANAQWQGRSIMELHHENKPRESYIAPIHICNKKHCLASKTYEEFVTENSDEVKSRKKRDIIDVLQSSYIYWINKLFGTSNRRSNNHPKYKIINGVKHVFYPLRALQRVKMPKETKIKIVDESVKPAIAAEDFNKGEIFEGVVESRMNRKKFHKMKETVNNTMDDNPWE